MRPVQKRPLIPIITDLLEYGPAANNTIDYTRKMVARYGDVCEVSFTGIKNYFIHDPEVIKEILTVQGPKMKRTRLFRAFRRFLGNGLFTSDGDLHRQQRKLIKPVFYPQRVAGYGQIMVDSAEEEIATWQDGQTIDVNAAMTRITLKIITRAMFGTALNNAEIEQVGKDLSVAFELMNRIIQNPFYLYCFEKDIQLPLISSFHGVKAKLDKVVNGIIAAYNRVDNADDNSLLGMLLAATDEETGAGMTDKQVRDEVMTFFVAGHETTTIALTWALYLLAKNPDAAAQMNSEVDAVLQGRKPTAGDYKMLPFTKNVFKETLRLYPPAWTFARECIEDVDICGYHFKKGECLWTVTYLLHHDERYFHSPEQFMPTRWDDPAMADMPKYAYFPFGGGNRMCIGEGFAWMEGVLVLATIAAKYSLQLPAGFTTDVAPLFTLRAKDKIMMTVRNR